MFDKIKRLKCMNVLFMILIAIIIVITLTLVLWPNLLSIGTSGGQMSATRLSSVDYKVYGRVQGVFFRKVSTTANLSDRCPMFVTHPARELGVVGWVQNHRDGTVIGTVQGLTPIVHQMKQWLLSEGSPYGSIDRCVFTNEMAITDMEFKTFDIR
ncbi:acylphosphatase-2-like isoform X1 [Oppia nitens]|uniref:acylphosphatase-2-like isoform X1 n=1 Tax=Oppia nitens TaxID=1686743 RepID=UPI0023DA1721|nr:acylphosphatase-2-like isoform X1 [Oppia nitens]